MVTLTALSTGFASMFFMLAGTGVYFSWKKSKSPLLFYFAVFLVSFGLQQIFFSLGSGVASFDPAVNRWFWLVAHFFMFIGITYFIRFPFNTKFPEHEETAFRIAAVYSVVGGIILLLNVGGVNSFLLDNSVYIFEVPDISGAVIGIFTAVCLLFSFGVFVMESVRISDRVSKVRALLIAAGILVFLVGGPMHNFVRTPELTLIADFSIIIGAFLMVAGVYTVRIIDMFNIPQKPRKSVND